MPVARCPCGVAANNGAIALLDRVADDELTREVEGAKSLLLAS